MDINITLFIQAFHFLIAYYILEKLFFRSTVATIEQEKKQYNDLLNTITHAQALLLEKEELKKQKWNAIKKTFAQTIPHIKTTEEKTRLPRIRPRSTLLNHHERQEYEQSLQHALVTRLKNVI